MSTPTPNSVEELLKIWRAHDIKASSPDEIRAAKERIRETLRNLTRPDDEATR